MNRTLLRTMLVNALFLMAVHVVCTPPAAFAQYQVTSWSADDGMPQNAVRGLAQTPDGYLWIATLDGLARFDGVRFTIFDKSNTRGIATNRFISLLMAPNGDLWLPTEGAHITHVHNGVFRTFDVDVLGVTGDAAGDIWILLHNNTILKWDPLAETFHEVVPTVPGIHYRMLRWDHAGFWASDKDGLHCFVRGITKTYPLPPGVAFDNVGVLAVDDRGGLWLETGDKRHVHVTLDGAVGELSKPNEAIAGAFEDVNRHTWQTQVGYHLNRVLQVPVSGHTVTVAYTDVYEDREKNLWLGNDNGGLYQIHQESIHTLSKEQGLVDRNVYPIFQDRVGAVWVGAWSGGLSRIDASGITNYTTHDGLPNENLTALAQDRDGRIWIGSHGGLGVLADKIFSVPKEPVIPQNDLVQAIVQDREGTLWFGTTAGLVSYRDGASHFFTSKDGLAGNDVRTIIEDPTGGLWIGGYGGLTRLLHGKLSHWTEKDGLTSNAVRAVYQDASGVLWIGTYDGGLSRFKDGHFTSYTRNNGLFSNGAFQILEDRNENLWISSNRGIYRLSKRGLNEFAESKSASIASVAYGKADGMLNVECNGGLWPAGIKANDGKLWFPTQDGVAIIDPSTVRHTTEPPPVIIESVTNDRVPLPLTEALRIYPGKENVEVQYTALSFINSKEIRFRYKLEGRDKDWVDAGLRRTAYYSHLPAARYVFHVIAVNSDGVWNTEGQSIAFTVLAPFYATWWFKILLVTVGLALIVYAWQRRVSQFRRAQTIQENFSRQLIASQENERKRIAGELHDSIGQRLVVINNLAVLTLNAAKKDAFARDGETSLEEIRAEALTAIEETRDISYNLRPFQLDRLGLTKAIGAMIRSVSAASGIAVTSAIDDIDAAFPEALRINFYRIVQESLNNVMKHSEADEVSVTVLREPDTILLIVRDNGRGFDGKSGIQEAGFGMTGMTERARSLGGELEVATSPGEGSTVKARIPYGKGAHV